MNKIAINVYDYGSNENHKASNLPEGWLEVTIDTIVDLNPPKPAKDLIPTDAPVTFVPMSAVDAYSGTIIAPEDRPFGAVRKGYTSFHEDDVIFAKITPCMENGKAAIARNLINGLGFGSTEFHVLRSTGSVIPEYLYYYIRQESFRRSAEAEMTGSVGQRRVPAEFVRNSLLPLPPLAEQKRIVAKVEELLARVNSTHEHLAKVQDILKRFRQSVLAAACSGRLTEGWRDRNPMNDSARKLLQNILSKRRNLIEENFPGRYKEPMEPADSQYLKRPKEWTVASMDQLTCLVTSGSRGWAKYYSEFGPIFVRAQNINTDKLCIDDAVHVQPPTMAECRRTRINYGDLLVTITGANVTKAGIVETEIPESYVSQHVSLIRPVDISTQHFMFLWTISSHHGRAKLLKDAYGAGKPGLNLKNIREMTIALPPLIEQVEIVRRVEALFKFADMTEKRVDRAIAHADKLNQAVLAKAFNGDLVPPETELARRDGRSYEPASALLAKIESQRKNYKSQRKRKGSNRGRN